MMQSVEKAQASSLVHEFEEAQRKEMWLLCLGEKCRKTFIKAMLMEKAVKETIYKTKCPHCQQNRKCFVLNEVAGS